MPDAQKRGSVVRAGDLLAELRRELAMHGRDVHADLLEHPARHHRHLAAAARRRRYDPCAATACGRSGRRRCHKVRCRRLALDRLEGRANVVAQPREPGARAVPCGVEVAAIGRGGSWPSRQRGNAARLPQRLAGHHGSRHGDIDRAQSRPHRDAQRGHRRRHEQRPARPPIRGRTTGCRRRV